MERLEKYIGSLANLNTFYKTCKILLIVSVVANLILGVALYKAENNKRIVVKINENGRPEPMEVTTKSMAQLINYKQFIHYSLNKMFTWNRYNYKQQLEQLLPLLAKSERSNYLEEVQKNEYLKEIKQNDITSTIQIKKIDTDSVVEYKDGWKIEVQAIKLKITDFIDRTIPVKITMAFRPTDITYKNIWGFEIFEIDETKL